MLILELGDWEVEFPQSCPQKKLQYEQLRTAGFRSVSMAKVRITIKHHLNN